MKEVFSYSPDGTLLHRTVYDNDAPVEDTADGTLEIYKLYHDDQGNLSRRELYRDGRLEVYFVAEYNGDGQKVQETEYRCDENGVDQEIRIMKLSYDEEGYLARYDNYIGGDLQYYILYEYE